MSDEPRQRGPEARLAQAFAMGRVEMAHEPVLLAAAEGVVVGQAIVPRELQREEFPLEPALARLVAAHVVRERASSVSARRVAVTTQPFSLAVSFAAIFGAAAFAAAYSSQYLCSRFMGDGSFPGR